MSTIALPRNVHTGPVQGLVVHYTRSMVPMPQMHTHALRFLMGLIIVQTKRLDLTQVSTKPKKTTSPPTQTTK